MTDSESPPPLQANLVFFYYRDLAAAQRFYEEALGLTPLVDQGFCTIYRVTPTSFVGLVDEAQGMHRATEATAVTLSFITEDLDAWYQRLLAHNVPMHRPLAEATRHPTRGFVALDPEGYYLEFETFLDHPQNAALREALRS